MVSFGIDRDLIGSFRALESQAVCVDFDGTISEIVGDPNLAQPLDGACEVLCSLAEQLNRVCVISGRPVSFLLDRLRLPNERPGQPTLFGLYGLEKWTRDSGTRVPHDLDKNMHRVDMVRRKLVGYIDIEYPTAGVLVEDKVYSVAVHYREIGILPVDLEHYVNSVAQGEGLRVIEGKKVLEIIPEGLPDKGSTLVEFCKGVKGVCVIGDDQGDLAAFRGLDALCASTLKVRVVVSGPETPGELMDLADIIVESPTQALELLSSLTN